MGFLRSFGVTVLFPFLIITALFFPVFFQGKTVFNTNFLVSYFSPWNKEKFLTWEHGVPFKPTGVDTVNLTFPYRQLAVETIRKGQFPLWNPYNFSGNILFADAQSGILSPLFPFFLLFPLLTAWNLTVILSVYIAYLFMFFLLREYKLSLPGSVFGATVFILSTRSLVWMIDHPTVFQTGLFFPLALLGLEGFITKKKFSYLLIFIAAIVLSCFSGFLQAFAYVLGFSIGYAFIRIGIHSSHFRQIIAIVTATILALGIASVQLIPTFSAFHESSRSSVSVGYLYDTFLMPISHLISFLIPEYVGNPATYTFIGPAAFNETTISLSVVGIILALFSLTLFRNDRRIKTLWIIAAASIVFGLQLPGIRNLYEAHIPVFSTFLPSRVFQISVCILSVLSAFGFEQIVKGENKKLLRTNATAILIFLLLFLIGIRLYPFLSSDLQTTLLRSFFRLGSFPGSFPAYLTRAIFRALFFTCFAFTVSLPFVRKKTIIAAILILGVILEQGMFAKKYFSFSEPMFLYPPHPVFTKLQEIAGIDRFWSYGDAFIAPNFATAFHVFSADGTDAFVPQNAALLYEAAKTAGSLPSLLPRIDIRIPQTTETDLMMNDVSRLRLLSLTGTKYVVRYKSSHWNLTEEETFFPSSHFRVAWDSSMWRIYKYLDVLPRFFLTSSFEIPSDTESALKRIYMPSFPLHTILLNKQPDKLPDGQATGSTHLISYTSNLVTIGTQTTGPMFLFFSDYFGTGWKASIDQQPQTLYTADLMFRAVIVPTGNHTVSFIYEPESFKGGLIVTIGSLSLLSIITIFFFTRNNNFLHLKRD